MAKLESSLNKLDEGIDSLVDDNARREMRKQYNELLRAFERHDFSTQHLLECMEDTLINN
ncbi:MAG: hypothetical protein NC218_03935 [Acetobacter sp.]|nr:hypothetical protein [Acetobacter sp.]